MVALARTVKARPLSERVSRGADDDAVLACALAAGADLIVSGGDDLLVLRQYQGVPVLAARQALDLFAV